ncbi:MAG: DegT/DnrJ/EryC1/StrS family aminotransferase [Planctomycetaceae bacterium]|nr:DegT/DnrJ/EryC1/StrS family aminotransferase [Planctomycetaceae bacterium]
MILFSDLAPTYFEIKDEIDFAINRALSSGWYIGGAEVSGFEKKWATYCDASRCVGIANGLDALTIALKALDIGSGDAVIAPSNTYIASWLAISNVGATVQPVEPNALTHNIDAAMIEKAITPATRAIMPVHLYGQPVDLDPILEVARRHNLLVIEDAAQAHGACYKGQRIGAHSDVVCWSFYPTKNLGAFGDAGAVTTNNIELADRIRCLANYGSNEKYINVEQGVNSRLDPLQAAVLSVKLNHLDTWTDRRRTLAQRYSEQLEDCRLTLPIVPEWADPVWHLYVVRSHERDRLQSCLQDLGIGTLIHYPIPPHMQKAYGNMGIAPDALPVANSLAQEVLSLPMGPHLTTEQQTGVIRAILDQ